MLADRASALVDLNERALALRSGGIREPDDDRDTGRGGPGGFGDDRGGFNRRCVLVAVALVNSGAVRWLGTVVRGLCWNGVRRCRWVRRDGANGRVLVGCSFWLAAELGGLFVVQHALLLTSAVLRGSLSSCQHDHQRFPSMQEGTAQPLLHTQLAPFLPLCC